MRNDLSRRANRQTVVRRESDEMRRWIMDRNGLVLAETVAVHSCFADPSLIKSPTAAAQKVAGLLGINEREMAQRIKKSKGAFLWLKRDVSPNIVRMIKDKNITGIGFKSEVRRHYPNGHLSPHLMGVLGLDGHGLSGVERAFEKSLDQRIPFGENSSEGIPAGHVQLTLDGAIQKIAERELDWGARKTGAKSGMVLVQNPTTGEILASAAWPPISMDPDDPPAPTEMRIPPLVDVFEPGSTFKVITAAAALEEKLVNEKETFSGENGKWKVMGITLHDHEPHNRLNFEDIMVYSSNIGTAKVADRLGSEKLYQYCRLFGFGVYPGSGLSGEAKGVLRPPSQWSGISKYSVSFGQEVGVTAIQVLGSFSAIANGGTLMEPHFVKGVVSTDGQTLWQNAPVPVRRVISPPTAARLSEILTQVVQRGTGVNAQVQWDSKTQVAGKTGTAQKFNNKTRRYDETLTLISFCGYFPAASPQYTMLVILDEPQGRRWGGLDAAPIFRRIAEQISPMVTSRKSE